MAQIYLTGISSQTRGSHRVKRANKHGLLLVRILKMMTGTEAERTIVEYLERAQLRLKLAMEKPANKFSREDRVALVGLLSERVAFENMLELDQMESIQAISRVGRCRSCNAWFWSRVKGQRYCKERCRVRHYQASPDGKKYKREWARREYQRIKKIDEERLLRARGSS